MMKKVRELTLIDINCPQCNIINKYEIFDAVRSDIDLRAKRLLLNGRLFEYKCKKCKCITNILYEIIYYDATRHMMIYFVEQSDINDACMAISETDQDVKMAWSAIVTNCQKRVVGDPLILREKVLILEQNMDDRVVELVKVVCADILNNADKRKPLHILFDKYNDDVCLNVHYSDEMIVTTFPQNLYEHFEHKFADILTLNKDYVIDENWAMDFMSNHELNDNTFENNQNEKRA